MRAVAVALLVTTLGLQLATMAPVLAQTTDATTATTTPPDPTTATTTPGVTTTTTVVTTPDTIPTTTPTTTPTPDTTPTTAPTTTTTAPPTTTTTTPPVGPTVTLLVELDAGLSRAQQDTVIASQGGQEVDAFPRLRLHVVEVPADSVFQAFAGYDADARVQSVSVDQVRTLAGAATDPSYAQQWALPKIGWDLLHGDVKATGSSTIAILDTGVDAGTPDLAGRVVGGWSFDDSSPTADPNGHGTHMATIAAAASDDGVGIAGVGDTGVRVMPVKVLGADGNGTDADIIAGLQWAVNHGANVVLMAFSGAGKSDALQAAIDNAWASGVVVIAAAGNGATSEPQFPAGDAKVVGVGATGPDDTAAGGTNTGAAVLLAAPGVGILASDAGGVTSVTGTSAAAAITAGAAALLRAVDPGASNATIVGRLARTTDPADGGLGNGRINLSRAAEDTGAAGVTPAGVESGGGPFVGPYVAAGTVGSVAFSSTTPTAGASAATWTVSFKTSGTATTLVSGSTVTVTLPYGGGSALTGFTVPAAPTIGLTSGFASCTATGATTTSTSTVVITLSGASCSLAKSTNASLTIAGITNPQTASSSAYSGSVVTTGDTTAGSGTLAVTVGTASRLAFTTSPAGATAGSQFTTQPVVAVQDTFGNTVTSSTASITLTIGTNPNSGTLSVTSPSTNPLPATSGVASFNRLSIDRPGTGYTLTAASTGLISGTSQAFNVAAQTPSSGAGTMTVSPTTTRAAGSSGDLTFSFTTPATASFQSGSQTLVTVPAGWTTPQTATAGAGYVSVVSGGTCTPSSVAVSGSGPWTITVSHACTYGTGFQILYAGAGTQTAGVANFTTQTKSGANAAAAIGSSPTVTVTALALSTLAFTVQPSDVLPATTMASVQVRGLDTYGNPVSSGPSAGASVTVELLNANGATLSGTTSQSLSLSTGVAAFSNLQIDLLGTGYALRASSEGVSVDSAQFNVTLPQAASGDGTMVVSPPTSSVTVGASVGTLAFTFTAPTGKPFNPGSRMNLTIPTGWTAPTLTPGQPGFVSITTAGCSASINSVSGQTVTVDQACASDESFVLSYANVTAQTAVGTGTATFTTRSAQYSGTFPTGSLGPLTTLTSGSPAVSVVVGNPVKLTFTTAPTASGTRGGVAFATQPVVTVQDFYGNRVTADTVWAVTLAIASGPAGASLVCTANPVSTVSGQATFAGCSIDKAGAYTLSATATGLDVGSASVSISSSVAASGDGSMSVSPTTVTVNSTNNTLTFTFTAPTSPAEIDFPVNSSLRLTIPSGWSAPTLTSGQPGYVTLTNGINNTGSNSPCLVQAPSGLSVSGQVITVGTFGCNAGRGFRVTYAAAQASTLATNNRFTTETKVGSGSFVGITASPSLSMTGGAAASIAWGQQPSTVGALVVMGPSPTVRLLDQWGNVSASTASVSVALWKSDGSGAETGVVFGGTKSRNASSGVATFDDLTVDTRGSYTLRATSGSFTAVTSDAFTVTDGPARSGDGSMVVSPSSREVASSGDVRLTFAAPGSLSFAVGSVVQVTVPAGWTAPQTGAPGAGYVSVQNADASCAISGDPVVSGSGPWTVTVTQQCAYTKGFELVYAGAVAPELAGAYAFTTRTRAGPSGSLTTIGSGSPSVTVTAGALHSLAFTVQPTNVLPLTSIAPSVTVTGRDFYNNVVSSGPSAGASVSLSLQSPPEAAGAVLSGTVEKPFVAGVATFSDLQVNKLGSGFTVTASSGLVTSPASNAFDVYSMPAVNGTGTMVVSPSTAVTAGSPVGPFTLTFTSPLGRTFNAGSQMDVTIPAGWTAPTLTSSEPGYVRITTPGCAASISSVSGQTVTVDQACGSNESFVLTYGSDGEGTARVTAGTTTGTATFATRSAQYDTVNGVPGSLVAIGSSPSVSVVVGDPVKLSFTTQPSGARGGVAFATQPVVTVQDFYGNQVTADAGRAVTLAIASGPAGASLVCTANPVPTVSGQATFAGCNIDKAGAYTLSATATGLDVGSASVSISSSVALSGQGTLTVSSQGQVAANSSSNNLTFTFTSPTNVDFPAGSSLRLTIPSGWSAPTLTSGQPGYVTLTNGTSTTGGGGLQNECVVQAPSGLSVDAAARTITVATFGCNAGRGFRIGFAATQAPTNTSSNQFTTETNVKSAGFTAISPTPSIAITPGAAASMAWGQQPGGVLAGSPMSPAPTVRLLDQWGNVSASTASVTVSLTGSPAGVTLGGTKTKSAVAGVATFDNLTVDTLGTGYTLTAVSGSFTEASAAFDVAPGPAFSGNGTMTVAVQDKDGNAGGTAVAAASTGNTLTFTFRAPNSQEFAPGSVTELTIPSAPVGSAGWTTPQLVSGQAGHVSVQNPDTSCSVGDPVVADTGTTGTGPWTVTVAHDCTAATGFQIVYSDVTAPNNGGPFTFTTRTQAGPTGTLQGIGSSPTVAITAGAASQLAFIVQPPATVGSLQTMSPPPQVAVQDRYGNTVTTGDDAIATVSVALSPSSGGLTAGGQSGTITAPAVAGVATFSGLKVDKSSSSPYTLVASATMASQASLTVASATFLVVNGTAPAGDGTLSVSSSPSPIVAGSGVRDFTLTFQTNPSRNFAPGSAMRFSVPSGWPTPQAVSAELAGYVSLSVGTCVKDPNDPNAVDPLDPNTALSLVTSGNTTRVQVAQACPAGTSFSITYSKVTTPTVAGDYTFSAQSRNGSGNQWANLTPQPVATVVPDVPSKLAFSAQPATNADLDGDVVFPVQPVVQVRDQYNNVVTTDARTVSLALLANPGGATLSCAGSGLNVATSAGVATFSGCQLDKIGSGYRLQASANGSPALPALPSNSFNIVSLPAVSGDGSFVVLPSLVTAGASGRSLAFTFTPSPGTNFLAGSQVRLTVPSAIESDDAAWPAPQTDNPAGPGYVSVANGAGSAACATAPVISAVSGRTVTVDVTCTTGRTITLTYADVTAPKRTGSFAFAAASNASGSGFVPLRSGNPTVTVKPDAPVAAVFAPGPGDITSGVPFGDATSPKTPVRVEIHDQFANVVTTDSTTSVALSVNKSATLTGTTTRTVTNGVATFDDLSVLEPGSDYTLTATATASAPSWSASVQSTPSFSVWPGTATSGEGTVTVATSPSDVVAGSGANTLTFTFTAPPGRTFPEGSTLSVAVPSGWTAPTTASGVAGSVALVAPTEPATPTDCDPDSITVPDGTRTITITHACAYASSFRFIYSDATAPVTAADSTFPVTSSGGSSAAAPITPSPSVSVVPGAAHHLEFAPAPPATVDTGTAIADVKVRVLDANDNLVKGDNETEITVALTASPLGAQLSGTQSKTVTEGVATFGNLAVDTVGPYTIEASVVAVEGGPTISAVSASFTAVLPPAANGDGTMTVSPTAVAVDSPTDAFRFTFTAPAGKDFRPGSGLELVIPASAPLADVNQTPTAWTAPTTTAGQPGSVSIDNGTGACAARITSVGTGATGPWTVAISQACPAGDTFTVTYANVRTPAKAAAATFTTRTKSGASGTATALTASPGSPTITVNPAPAVGIGFTAAITSPVGSFATLTPTPRVALYDQFANVVTTDSTTSVAVALQRLGQPAVGLRPSSAPASTVTNGVATFNNLSVDPVGTDYSLVATATLGGSPVTARSSTFTVNEGTAVDGDGRLAVTSPSPASVVASETAQTFTFTFTANANRGFPTGSFVRFTTPTGWSLPVTTPGAPGYVAATATESSCKPGTVLIGSGNSANRVTIPQECAAGKSFTISYLAVPNTTAGAYTFPASSRTGSGGNGSALAESPTVTVVPAIASKLAFSAQPTVGANLDGQVVFPPSMQPVVQFQDKFGNVVPNDTRRVTLSLAANPGGATLACTSGLNPPAVASVVTYAGCQLNNTNIVANGYTLFAQTGGQPGVIPATSNSFNIVSVPAVSGEGSFASPSPSSVTAGVADQSLAFTFTVPTGKSLRAGSQVSLTVPAAVAGDASAWPAPQPDDAGAPGYVSVANGSPACVTPPTIAGVSGRTVTVNVDCSTGQKVTLRYTNVTPPAKVTALPVAFPAASKANGGTSSTLTLGSPAVSVVAGQATQLVFTQQPLDITSGSPFTPTVTVEIRDQFNNVVPTNALVTLTVSPAATLAGTAATSASNGVASFAGVSVKEPGEDYTLTATATPGATPLTATSDPFDVSVGPAESGDGTMTVTTTPTTVAAGSTGNTLRFTFATPLGRYFPTDSAVTIAVPDGWTAPTTEAGVPGSVALVDGGTCAPDAITVPAGTRTIRIAHACAFDTSFQVTYSGATASTKAGNARFVTATTAGTAGTAKEVDAGSPTVAVQPLAPTKLGFPTAPPTTVDRGTAFTIAVAVQDTYGNVITDDSGTEITLALVDPSPAGAQLGGDTTVTVTDGVATFSDLTVDKVGIYTLRASSSAYGTVTTSIEAVLPPATDGDGTMSVSPASVLVGSSGHTFTFTFAAPLAQDFRANSAMVLTIPAGWSAPTTSAGAGQPGQVSVVAGSDTGCDAAIGTITANGSAWDVPVAQTCAAGTSFQLSYVAGTAPTLAQTVTFTTKSRSGVAGTPTILTAGSPTVTVSPDVPHHLAFIVAPPARVVQDATLSPAPTVAVQDRYDNVTPSAAPVTLTLTKSPGALAGTAVVNPSSGLAAFSGLSVTQFDYGYQLVAASPDINGATSTSFDVGAPWVADGAGTMTVSAPSPATITAGTSANNLAFTFAAPSDRAFPSGSAITLTVPNSPWTAPQTTTAANPGYVSVDAVGARCQINPTPTIGTRTITVAVTGTCDQGTGFRINYTGVTVPTLAGVATFTTQTRSGSAGTLTNITTIPTVTVAPAAASKIAFTTQPGQANKITGGAAFPVQPVVTVQDQYNNTVTSDTRSITLSITAATGTAGAVLACTQPSRQMNAVAGVAAFTGCNVDKPGTGYTLTATSTAALNAPVSTAFSVVVGPPAKIVLSGDTSTVVAGATRTVTATVQDAGGNVTTANGSGGNASVTFTQASGTGSVSGTGAATASSGVATKILTGNLAGPVSITASATVSGTTVTSVAPVTFTVIPGNATKIGFVQSPGTTTAGVAFATQPKVTVQDPFGNTVTNSTFTQPIALTITNGTGTVGASLACDQAGNAVSPTANVATFSGCKIQKSGTGYTLTATTSGLSTNAAISSAFTVVPAAPAKLVLGQPPTNTVAGAPITPGVTVRLLDQFDNLTTSTDAVSVAVTGGTATLKGTVPQAAVAGVATFADLSIDKAGTGYTLTATSGALSVLSDPFTISVGPAHHLGFGVQPGNVERNTTMSPAVTVDVLDAVGNVVTADSATDVTLALSDAQGATLAGTLTRRVTNGVATFGDLAVDQRGTYTLAATATGVAGVASDPFQVTLALPVDGAGAMTVSPTSATAGVAQSYTFTFTSPSGKEFPVGSRTRVTVPTGWTPPTSTEGQPGFVSVASGDCDATLQGVSGQVITVAQACIDGGSFTIAYAAAKTDTAGSATFTTATRVGSSGTATPIDASPTVEVAPGAAAKVVTTMPAGRPIAGTPFTVGVAIEDALGNVRTSDDVTTVTLDLVAPAAGPVVSAAPSKAVTDGVATFTVTVADPGYGYQLQVSTDHDPGLDSPGATFDVGAPPAANGDGTVSGSVGVLSPASVTAGSTGNFSFEFTVPSNRDFPSGSAFTLTVPNSPWTAPTTSAGAGQVTVSDLGEHCEIGAPSVSGRTITVPITGGCDRGSGFTVNYATATAPTATGTATFTAQSKSGSGGTLTDLAAGSPVVTIAPGPTAKLGFTSSPGATVTIGIPFSTQPQIAILDQYDNPVTTDTRSIALSISPAGGTLTCDQASNTAAAVAGVASFTGCKITQGASTTATTYTITASTTSGTTFTTTRNVTAAVGKPAPITTLLATPGWTSATGAQAALSWTAPASGGAPISNYDVRFSTSPTMTSPTLVSNINGTNYTRTGLTGGTTYYFQVAARNSQGFVGDWNTPVTAVPYAPPGTVASVTATAGAAKVELSWPAAASNGAAITSYDVQYSNSTTFTASKSVTVVQVLAATTGTTYTVTNSASTPLTVGTRYYFRVRATNVAGTQQTWGPASTTTTSSNGATPYTTPGAPGTPTAVRDGFASMALRTTAPTATGGAPITNYRFTAYVGTTATDKVCDTNPTSLATVPLTCSITGLSGGTSYTFKAQAFNAAGGGTASASSAALAAVDRVPFSVGAVGGIPVTASSNTALTLTPNSVSAVPAGARLLVYLNADTTTQSTSAPTITSVSFPGSATAPATCTNTYTAARGGTTTQAGSGIRAAIIYCAVGASGMAAGAQIQVNVSNATNLVGMGEYLVGYASGGTVTAVAATSGTGTTAPASGQAKSVPVGRLVIGAVAFENGTSDLAGDSDTTGGSWAGKASAANGTSGPAAGLSVTRQYKWVTAATTQQYNTGAPAANEDWIAFILTVS